MIRLENVSKKFGSAPVVDDVSFAIGAGEMLVLVGPSGCGKTTLLRLIAGLERIDAGAIFFDGQLINEIRPKHRNISFVFQDFALLPHINIYENIAYGLKSRGVKRSEVRPRVLAAAKRFRVDSLLKRKPAKLSGGERQRVAPGRALVRNSTVTLFDEPLSSLDAPLRWQARSDIMALHRQKQRPSLYVTHDQSEAMAMGDRIALMQAGKIVQIDTPSALYNKPANRFVAEFIGSGINWFEPNELLVESPSAARLAGIRPEHMELVSAESSWQSRPTTHHFRGTVKSSSGRLHTIAVQHRADVHIHTTHYLEQNDSIQLTINPANILWFDKSHQLLPF